MEKKTKAMYFAELREMVTVAVEDEARRNELVEFIDKQVEALEKRKVAAAARAEKKKAESDALTEEIFERIGDELITVDEIVITFDEEEEVSRAKVTARLGKLVNAGRIEKEAVKVDGKKRMAYRLPKTADAE
jgi:hypothetical protein